MAVTTMSKVTWWNRLRVEKNIRYQDLSDLFGGCPSMWGGYFSGQHMPKEDAIKKLCDLFDVDYEEGLREFALAHRNWESSQHKGVRPVRTGDAEPYEKKAYIRAAPINTAEHVSDIKQIIYGKVSYSVFVEFCTMLEQDGFDAIGYLYGKVPYDIFRQIQDCGTTSEEPNEE